MVRTLVFHTNNVGSIPTGLNMHNTWQCEYATLVSVSNPTPVKSARARYSFRFMSIIAPLVSDSTIAEKSMPGSRLVSRRPLMKKSYLLLSWLGYLTAVGPVSKKHSLARLAILPSRRSKYTLTKAPMAHKTNSKEQFLFKFYNFKFSYECYVPETRVSMGFNRGGHVMGLTKQYFPAFETNLLLLKYCRISHPISAGVSLANLTKAPQKSS